MLLTAAGRTPRNRLLFSSRLQPTEKRDSSRCALHRGSYLLCLISCSTLLLGADPSPRFESHIAPLFKAKCLSCHSAGIRQGGLSLETREDVLRGGKTGAAVVPGRPTDSLLLAFVMSGKMPMGGSRLNEVETDTLRRWIEAGALMEGEQEATKLVHEREVFASILGGKCFVCHGRRMQKAGLDLRTREALLKGGKSGPAIVPGNPDQSLLLKKIAAQEMPPPKLQEQYSVRGLTQDEFDKVKAWIAAGAPADDEKPLAADPALREKDQQHWAFRPPTRAAIPSVRDGAKVRNPIDAFLLAKLEEKGLTLSEPADPLVLMRRAFIDLTGMPPSPEEIDAYLADRSPEAYERLIDKLLASPRYGERWARYWLDAAGYADSEGAVSADNVRPHAWRYRDYVIRALNSDKPYDQFLTEQIAGDELFDYKSYATYSPDQIEKLVATGFLRTGPDSTYSTEQNFLADRYDTVAGEMEILGTAVMGLTIGCARCHDHKYDPIPQRDYYRLSAILQSAYDPYDWRSPSLQCVGVGAKCVDDDTRDLPLRSPQEERENGMYNGPIRKRIEALEKSLAAKAAPFREKLRAERLEKLPEELRQDLKRALDTAPSERSEIQRYVVGKFEKQLEVTDKEIADRFEEFRNDEREIQLKVRDEKGKLRPDPKIRALFDMGGTPTPNRVLLRGDVNNPGFLVEPGPPFVVSRSIAPYKIEKPAYRSDTSGRRLALARWLTQPNHPLTARVMVNRIWQHHFGTGLAARPANFGKTGLAPTHPELLDWLATEFVRQDWSIKAMQRLIMTSSAYRQSSRYVESRHSVDPDNRFLSRFPLRRLDADSLYDSVLKVAGRLDESSFGPPAEISVKPDGEIVPIAAKRGYRRGIYLQQRRSRPVTMLETFDAPLLNPNCIRRSESTVSLQALQLMNSDLLRENSRYLAGRVIDAAGDDPAKQVERLYLATLSRRPSPEEAADLRNSLERMREAWHRELESDVPAESILQKARWLALASLCHTVLNSAEFLYVD
jgi:mono/diheme cytochrome c family protein